MYPNSMSRDPEPKPTALTRRDFLQAAGVAVAVGGIDVRSLMAGERVASQFDVTLDGGAILHLKRVGDAFDTD